MRARFLPQVLALTLAAASAGPCLDRAWAQTSPPVGNQTPSIPEPPEKLPKNRADQGRNIDFLFEALKAAPDDESAKLVEHRIWALWLASGSDTADLLMSRVKAAAEGKDLDLAIELLDKIIAIKPDYVEAWNRRSTIYFGKKDFGRSLSDVAQVLAREPRHFGALTELGTILQEIGDDKRALEAYRRALAVHPRLQKLPDLIKTLTEKVEGRDI
jgi:tetratricopeptide (TPR) repeat protein